MADQETVLNRLVTNLESMGYKPEPRLNDTADFGPYIHMGTVGTRTYRIHVHYEGNFSFSAWEGDHCTDLVMGSHSFPELLTAIRKVFK